MSQEHRESSVGTYILIALILGVITYLEFAIVEYDISWLSTAWIFIWLAVLSVVKFILVVAFFMHLKDDEATYTGFFSSGMVIAMGTFVALTFLFTVRSVSLAVTQPPAEGEIVGTAEAGHANEATVEAAGGEHGGESAGGHGEGLSAEIEENIASDGYSRPLSQVFDAPRPKDQSVNIVLPTVENPDGFTLKPAPALFASASSGGASGGEASGGADTGSAGNGGATGGSETGGGAAVADFDRALGESTYNGNCVSCHQTDGKGLAGVFPPLAGHMPELYAADGGREYLVDVLLYGLQGEIQVQGTAYNGVMPAWAQLSNEQIAAVLNHELTSWGNDGLLEGFEPIRPDEVEAQRGQNLSASDVHDQRGQLSLP